jgi:dTDP-4-dehydrorhamnose reductase
MIDHLILSANGLIGGQLWKILQSKSESTLGTCFSRSTNHLIQLNILDLHHLEKFLQESKPQNIYFASNYPGGVNKCEVDALGAEIFHIKPLEIVSRYCRKFNATFVYYSTDYVFSDNQLEVTEGAERSPLNVYGKLKLRAENLIRDTIDSHLILRTTNVYGLDLNTKTPNYMMQVLRTVWKGEKFLSNSKIMATPTYVDDLAQISALLVRSKKFGTYHVVGDEFMNRYEWARRMVSHLGYSEKLIEDIPLESTGVSRPINLKLSNQKLINTLGKKLTTLESAMSAIKEELKLYTFSNVQEDTK